TRLGASAGSSAPASTDTGSHRRSSDSLGPRPSVACSFPIVRQFFWDFSVWPASATIWLLIGGAARVRPHALRKEPHRAGLCFAPLQPGRPHLDPVYLPRKPAGCQWVSGPG